MEQNKNNRLDELFNQAKNEPSKVSFEKTKEQFINSSASFSNKAAKGGKLAQFLTLKKLIIMIITISAIGVGSMLLFNTFSEPSNKEQLITLEEDLKITDSILSLPNHDKEFAPNLESAINYDEKLTQEAEIEKELEVKNDYVLDLNTPKKSKDVGNSATRKKLATDNNYRFPKLTPEEIKENNKRKAKLVKMNSKKEQFGYLHIDGGEMTVNGKSIKVASFEIKQTEVSNIQYKTFLFDLLIQHRNEEFLIAKPDPTQWTKKANPYFKPMEENYFSSSAYDDYPVVNISREAAKLYCKWLSTEINKTQKKKLKGMISEVRLPSSNEWMYAASGGGKMTYAWAIIGKRQNERGCFLANYRYSPKIDNVKMIGCEAKYVNAHTTAGLLLGEGVFTVKVSSYNANEFDLYCMSGNVAEMVLYPNNEVGAKGGSWNSLGENIKVMAKDEFKGISTPNVNIGFRPVITYLGSGRAKSDNDDPMGTVRITDKLHIDRTEVTNFHWQEYMTWNARKYGKTSKEYKNSIPDTLVWNDLNNSYQTHYLTHPAYNNYPVVGISHEQASAFCKWRTALVKEYYVAQQARNKKEDHPINFEYRLPSIEEWEMIADAGYSDKTLKVVEGKYADMYRNNIKRDVTDMKGSFLKNGADITAPVQSYWPNKYGVYNMIGNVAEMIDQKGIAKGGSWVHKAKESTVEKDLTYNEPESWLGFRCVLEIQE